jgi:DNA polymerase I
MYPNLMERYNLSPDTLVKPEESVPRDSVFIIPEVNHRFRKEPRGLYAIALSTLIQRRRAIQKEMAELGERSTRYKVLRERERATKIITNACYGYAGWAGARWYAKEVAESATALGRDVINRTIEKARSLGLNVIYGDTDSIFVKDEPRKVEQLHDWAEREFGLDIKREHEYVRVLFTEAMKRYAGLLRNGTLDIVGLEVVRGDWSDIARQVQEQVLIRILRDQSTEKAVQDVRATIAKLRNRQVPLADLTIRKTLTKPIEDYAVRTPHVEVAKLLVKQGWYLTVGDKVAYVITKGPGKLFQKAKPTSQVKSEDVDIEYYVDNQIKPAAMRILERFGVTERQLVV